MASVPEERIAFIEQKIPELITSLSGFNVTDLTYFLTNFLNNPNHILGV